MRKRCQGNAPGLMRLGPSIVIAGLVVLLLIARTAGLGSRVPRVPRSKQSLRLLPYRQPGESWLLCPGPARRMLVGGVLDGQNLRVQHWDDTSLMAMSMKCVDLRHVSMRDACLSEVDLRGADLRDSSLVRAYFYEVDLTGAKLEGASLKGLRYDSRTRWPSGLVPETLGARAMTTGEGDGYR